MTDEATEAHWPLRARFAHWAIGWLADWASLAPDPEPEWPDTRAEDAAYDAGIEYGYRLARDDMRREDPW